jgi:hypothetical protein
MRSLLAAVPLFTLVLAAPAAASTSAVAGPSPTPLILELVLAAAVIGGMVLRRRVGHLLAGARRLRPHRPRAWVRARGV